MYNDESTNCGETIISNQRAVCAGYAKRDHLYPLKALLYS